MSHGFAPTAPAGEVFASSPLRGNSDSRTRAAPIAHAAWKILLVDDEEEVHAVTELVLSGFTFEGRGLEFVHAYTGREAKALVQLHPDVAVMIVDVVMENDSAGLDLVRYVREELRNLNVRVVLRTGQPGQAPETEVIRKHDINDYKEKTELTSKKLSTLMYSTLRGFRDLLVIERNKRGLEQVIKASAHIFSQQRSTEFASAVLDQLTGLIGVERGSLYCPVLQGMADAPPEHFDVAAATGVYANLVRAHADEQLPPHIASSLRQAFIQKQHLFADDHYVLHFTDAEHGESLLYVGDVARLSELDLNLLQVFCTNVSIAFKNLHMNQEMFESQLEMICLLAGAAEVRSRESASHVKRVGLLSEHLATAAGKDASYAEALRFAAPLHDIGKIGVSDSILCKPGAHTPEETVVMRTHAEIGQRMLATSRRPLLRLAAEIAGSHHENWDGTGYPNALAGEAIPFSGRVVALADVFDALGSKRCYKDAWSDDSVRNFILAERGRKFDPTLVDILMAGWTRAEAIRILLPD
jgi:response regulator RpfG family c-di-GMP phosphodiesterase